MSQLIRSNIRSMQGYTPGEQPREAGIIKLNTNENPYPPSPLAMGAIEAILKTDRLRKYPEPMGHTFRLTASKILEVDPDSILIGNGSDDVLTILTRTFVKEGGQVVSPTPSYLLYKTLADIQGASFVGVPYVNGWDLPRPWPIRKGSLTFVANPNSPSGTIVSNAALETLAQELEGPLVVDEAYVDFAEANAIPLTKRHAHVIVTRTLSKSYSLAGLRFGFAIADPALIREFNKVKDSYNCDMLSLAGATAALEDQIHLRECRAKILTTRTRLIRELRQLGFDVLDSHANFAWATRSDRPVKPIFEELKNRKILVRYMDYGPHGNGLRITVGTDIEIDQLLANLRTLV